MLSRGWCRSEEKSRDAFGRAHADAALRHIGGKDVMPERFVEIRSAKDLT